MKEELISIIVPVYNVEQYLSRCVESILNQTYKKIEIILVNDGSTDNCGKICDEYAKKDKRIKVIHKENGGLSDARNKGIDVATGKYIGFVDSDDWILPTMYEDLYNTLLKYNGDISICDFIETDGTKSIEQPKNKKIIVFNKDKAIKELIVNKKIKDYAWNKLYRAELFKEIRYPFGKNMEDKGTTYKLFLESNKIVSTNIIEYMYFYRENSIVNNVNYKLIYDDITLTIERYKCLKEIYPNKKILSTKLFRLLVIYYYSSLKNNNKDIIKLFKQEKFFKYIEDKLFFIDLKTLLQFIIIIIINNAVRRK